MQSPMETMRYRIESMGNSMKMIEQLVIAMEAPIQTMQSPMETMRYRIESMGNSMKTMQQLVSVVQSPVKNR